MHPARRGGARALREPLRGPPAVRRLLAPAPAAAATASAPKPPITVKLIPFGATRKAQMADYSRRHYHQHTWKLTHPKAIVLHHTAGATWQPAWWTFANNTAYDRSPANPRSPASRRTSSSTRTAPSTSACRSRVRGRHAIGMNWTSIGIEFVQEGKSGKDGHWMDRQILARTAQANAGLRLVRYLQARFGIKTKNVVGHATANDSPYFKEYTGIKNAAGDWFAPEVKRLPRAAVGDAPRDLRRRRSPPPGRRLMS